MFATKVLRAAERQPLIKFIGKRTTPTNIDHTPKAHPASGLSALPESFTTPSKPTSFSSYRQTAQQHGPLGRTPKSAEAGIGGLSGQSLGEVQPAKGEFFDRNELPARFRRARIDLSEIEAVETGGASLFA